METTHSCGWIAYRACDLHPRLNTMTQQGDIEWGTLKTNTVLKEIEHFFRCVPYRRHDTHSPEINTDQELGAESGGLEQEVGPEGGGQPSHNEVAGRGVGNGKMTTTTTTEMSATTFTTTETTKTTTLTEGESTKITA